MPDTEPTANDKFHQLTEQFCCPDCEGLINRENALVDYPKSAALEVIRTIRARCEHCNKLWRARQVLIGGVWTFRDSVHSVASADALATFQRDLARKLGRMAA